MSYTETETITHSFQKSGLLAADETLSAEDLDFGQKVYRSRLAALNVIGIKPWNLTAASVPDELLDPLAEYIAMFLLSANGGPHPVDAQQQAAEGTLRRLCAMEPTGEVIGATYF